MGPGAVTQHPRKAENSFQNTQGERDGAKNQIQVCLRQRTESPALHIPLLPMEPQQPLSGAISQSPGRQVVSAPQPKAAYELAYPVLSIPGYFHFLHLEFHVLSFICAFSSSSPPKRSFLIPLLSSLHLPVGSLLEMPCYCDH